ncbi:hypothetical protein H6P81_000164 [Aristolochia fimbriata]|uniref:G domain-containing protein n=1 Tax=Aristolochia fimbriata TaxID=158543 RepID=A0AAV7F741_ARIFI|nr:hypothetical protein H6P81_000164 [Aristolochia fimbriata]
MLLARRCSSLAKLRQFVPPLFSISCPNPSDLPLSHILSSVAPTVKYYQGPLFPQGNRPLTSKINTFLRDGNYDESSTTQLVCPGCGVHMQGSDPKLPGFFTLPSKKRPDYRVTIDWNPIAEESEISNSLKRGKIQESDEGCQPDKNASGSEKPVVCARCHSLRHYGKVKDTTVENLLPDFDFDHTISPKLVTASGSRSVVIMVADASDFDGSFPRKVAKLVSNTIEENYRAWKEGKPGNVPRVVLVVTKIDLLPPSLSPTAFEHWVRQRAREGGANKLTSVHLVSAIRNWGLKNLVDDVRDLVGPRGNVWAIGAQNAGKSTLINAMAKCVGGKISELTEAPVPGTTLGIVRVEGVLAGQAKLFDTPGILHPFQISTRLTREEQKLVHISKELGPRTYRIKEGHSIHIGGLARLDVEKLSVDTVYVTVWASPHIPLHMGKMENASLMVDAHFGRQLQPPVGEQRIAEIGEWMRREFKVCGNSWEVSSVDVAVAGLGWYAIALKGEAVLGVWTYDGVDLIMRNSLIPRRAQIFEVAGFTVSKIVSQADRALNKQQKKKKDKKAEVCSRETLSDVVSTLELDADGTA